MHTTTIPKQDKAPMPKQNNSNGDIMPNTDLISLQIEKLTAASSFWNTWYMLFFALTAIATFACVFGTYFVNMRAKELSAVKDEQLRLKDEQNKLKIASVQSEARKYTADVEAETKLQIEKTRANADVKIADAKAIAATANERAESAITEQGKLKQQSLDLQSRVEKEQITRLELEKSLAPREIPLKSDSAGVWNFATLQPFAGTEVILTFLHDIEARRTAYALATVLQTAGWKIIELSGSPELDAQFFDGIVVETVPGLIRNGDKSHDAADALLDFLSTSNILARTHPGKHPPNRLKIIVGFKPSPYFMDERLKKSNKQIDEMRKKLRDDRKS